MEILVTTGGGSRKSFLSLVSSHRQIWDYYTTYKQGILQEILPSWISPFYKQTLILYTIQKVDAEFKTLGEGSVSVNLDTTIRDMDPAFVPRWEKLARKTLNSVNPEMNVRRLSLEKLTTLFKIRHSVVHLHKAIKHPNSHAEYALAAAHMSHMKTEAIKYLRGGYNSISGLFLCLALLSRTHSWKEHLFKQSLRNHLVRSWCAELDLACDIFSHPGVVYEILHITLYLVIRRMPAYTKQIRHYPHWRRE